MKQYNVNELYEKKWLTVDEVAYLLGGINLNNLYTKFNSGALKYSFVDNGKGKDVRRVDSRDLFEYIAKRKRELLIAAERLQLPTSEIDWENRK